MAFEQLKAELAGKDNACIEFVDLFARFQKDALAASALINEGKATKHDRYRMHLFAKKVDDAWIKIPEAQRPGLVEMLLIKKLLPEEVKKALQIFNGKVLKIL